MSYEVQTWDDQHKCVRFHSVVDAIDFEDAEQVVKGLHPEQKIISIIRRADD
ncbi:hypothetical protein [Synechococcus phage S-H25]|nr:hypothetical protein [Synechococcus phage S-H25]